MDDQQKDNSTSKLPPSLRLARAGIMGVCILGLLGALGYGVFRTNTATQTPDASNQNSKPSAPVPQGESVVYMDAVPKSHVAGESGTIAVRIKPGPTDAITAVTLDMSYDENLIAIHDITTNESPFSLMLEESSLDEGGVRLSVGVPFSKPIEAVRQDVLVATVAFTALKAFEEFPLTFTDETVASAVGKTSNVVRGRVMSSRTIDEILE